MGANNYNLPWDMGARPVQNDNQSYHCSTTYFGVTWCKLFL